MNEDFNQIFETLCYDQICKKTFLRLKIYRSICRIIKNPLKEIRDRLDSYIVNAEKKILYNDMSYFIQY